jgi:hypothetical protein
MNITLEHGALIFLILMITNQLKRVKMSVGRVLELAPNLHEVSRQVRNCSSQKTRNWEFL